ncbi:MAG: hypothetical protein V1903_09455 [Bacteroidota bacterium]
MEVNEPDLKNQKHRKLKKTLLVFFLTFISGGIIFIFFSSPVGAILLLLALLDLILLISLGKKYYNWTFIFLLLIVTAILYRSQRWPLSGVWFTLGFSGLAINSLYLAWVFWKRYHHNKFLKYIGFSTSLILSILTIGILYKNMHWPFAGLFLNIGMAVFIPFLFAFVFMLPSSKFNNWSKDERTVFFRAIIIPMTFVYILSVLMFVFPDLYRALTRLPLIPFNMSPGDITILH